MLWTMRTTFNIRFKMLSEILCIDGIPFHFVAVPSLVIFKIFGITFFFPLSIQIYFSVFYCNFPNALPLISKVVTCCIFCAFFYS